MFWGQILSSGKFSWPEAGRRQVKIIIDHSIAAIDEYVTGEGAAAGLVILQVLNFWRLASDLLPTSSVFKKIRSTIEPVQSACSDTDVEEYTGEEVF